MKINIFFLPSRSSVNCLWHFEQQNCKLSSRYTDK